MNPGVDFCQHAHQFPTHLIVEQTRPPFIFERPMNTFGMESSTFTEVSPNRECFFLSLANVKQIVDSYLLDLIRRELYHENGEEIHELGYGPRRECCEPRHRRRFEGRGEHPALHHVRGGTNDHFRTRVFIFSRIATFSTSAENGLNSMMVFASLTPSS